MKLRCGLTWGTKFSIKQQKIHASIERYRLAVIDGEVFTPWWPRKVGDNDCRVFEPVRRILVDSSANWDFPEKVSPYDIAVSIVLGGKSPIWRYEAINKESTP